MKLKTQKSTVALYPVGIARSRDVPTVAGLTLAKPTVADETARGQVDVRWVLAEELACAAINSPDVTPKPLEHVAALHAIHNGITVLPIRFGTQMTDEEGVCHLLLGQCQELMQCLDRVEGASEIGLRISPPPCQLTKNVFEKGATAGRSSSAGHGVLTKTRVDKPHVAPLPADYLAHRQALYQHEDWLKEQACLTTDRYVQKLDGLYRQWRNLASSPPGVIRLAFLVERDRVDLFRDRLEVLRDAKQDQQCELLGPWPPYSFV